MQSYWKFKKIILCKVILKDNFIKIESKNDKFQQTCIITGHCKTNHYNIIGNWVETSNNKKPEIKEAKTNKDKEIFKLISYLIFHCNLNVKVVVYFPCYRKQKIFIIKEIFTIYVKVSSESFQ